MQIAFRQYNSADDYQRISDFLIAHHRPGNRDGNWLEPAWEYMHFHPLLDSASLAKIGVWEEGDDPVALPDPLCGCRRLPLADGLDHVGLTILSALVSRLWAMRVHPDLLAERASYAEKTDAKPWDRKLLPWIAVIPPLATQVVAGLNYRFGWPPALAGADRAGAGGGRLGVGHLGGAHT